MLDSKINEIPIVRKIDELGRMVLPAEFRILLEIQTGDILSISLENEGNKDLIKLKKCPYEDIKSELFAKKVDELGRIVLPQQIRSVMDIEEKDDLEVFLDEEKKCILIQKKIYCCMFTGSIEKLVEYKGKIVSKEAINKLIELYNKKYGDDNICIGALK